MNDIKPRTIFWIGMGLTVLITTWAILAFEERTDKCNSQGGVLVKTTEGWRCMDRKMFLEGVFKNE